jgi:opacity protein-like surface antigen
MKLLLLSLSLMAVASSASAADTAPPPPPTSFAFEEVATLAPAQILGETPIGRRQSVPITGGTFSGPGLSGRILPGGADYQLVRADGAVTIDADYMIETDDHVTIHVRNVGVIVPPGNDRAAYAWAAPKFDAPNGRYGWMNSAIFVSRISPAGDKAHPAVRITIWKVG